MALALHQSPQKSKLTKSSQGAIAGRIANRSAGTCLPPPQAFPHEHTTPLRGLVQQDLSGAGSGHFRSETLALLAAMALTSAVVALVTDFSLTAPRE